MSHNMRPIVETWGPPLGLSSPDPAGGFIGDTIETHVEMLEALGGEHDESMDSVDDCVVIFPEGKATLLAWVTMDPPALADALLREPLSHWDGTPDDRMYLLEFLNGLKAMAVEWFAHLDDGMLKFRVGN